MTRTEIIQNFINRYQYTSYLELGVLDTNINFNKIVCNNKVGVDPAVFPESYKSPDRGYEMTSDDYFKTLTSDVKYDLIFIDGLHTQAQVDKDITNSLKHLSEKGTIVLHDCSPPTLADERPTRCGTVWRSIYNLRKTTHNLHIYVIDTDYGCGVIHRGIPSPVMTLNDEELNYNFLATNRIDVLNLTSVGKFLTYLS